MRRRLTAIVFCAALFFGALGIGSPAFAACTSPAGNSGDKAWNTTLYILCDGTSWNNLTMTTQLDLCSTIPSATLSSMKYDSTRGVYKVCDGTYFDQIACYQDQGGEISEDFVSVGNSGTVDISNNGTTWALNPNSFGTNNIMTVAYGGNLWVAAGAAGTLETSTFGTAWTAQTTGFGANQINYVAYNGSNLWAAVGNAGTLETSSDGVTWTPRTSGFGTDNITGIAYNGSNLWVAVGSGYYATSPDATTWTVQPGDLHINTTTSAAIAYGGSQWIAAGTSGALATASAVGAWTTQTSGFGASNIYGVAYNGSTLWVAVGQSGKIYTSPDGITWTGRTSNTANQLNSVAYGGGVWVAGGNSGTIDTSADGTNWATKTSQFGSNNILGVAYDGSSVWVAVGAAGDISSSTAPTTTWTARTSNTSNQLNDVAYNASNLWVAVGNSGTIVTSANGTTWSAGATIGQSIAYGGGTWVTGGASGTIATSTDSGATWTARSNSFGSNAINAIAYNGSGAPVGGLVGWWKLDDGSSGTTPTTAADSSGNGNTGTLTNGPTWTTSGIINNALTFNGTGNYVISTAAQTYFDQAPFTISAWVYFSVLPSTGSGMQIADGSLSSSPWQAWNLWAGSDNYIYFNVTTNSGGSQNVNRPKQHYQRGPVVSRGRDP